jgi:hypothetical protein
MDKNKCPKFKILSETGRKNRGVVWKIRCFGKMVSIILKPDWN